MRVAVSGLGLIGGSFYKASIAAGHTTAGLHHGDSAGLSDADLILVCQPPESIVPWIEKHAADIRDGAVVVDVCGIKRPVVKDVVNLFSRMKAAGTPPRFVFVGGHPMAGREVSGYENSSENLFRGASMIITPSDGTDESVITLLKGYFASVGFHETVITTPEKHDAMIAFTSQLCHIIATTYARDPRVREAVGFTAGSYANMTRIATQDASIWSSLYSENSDMLVEVLDDFAKRFGEIRDAIAAGDSETVISLIKEGTAAKRAELLMRQRGDENV